jgi:hypothetical protein
MTSPASVFRTVPVVGVEFEPLVPMWLRSTGTALTSTAKEDHSLAEAVTFRRPTPVRSNVSVLLAGPPVEGTMAYQTTTLRLTPSVPILTAVQETPLLNAP